MKTLFRPYEYITPEGRRGHIDMLLAVEFGPEAQELYRLSFSSACADAIMRHSRDAIVSHNGLIDYNSSYEGGFALSAGSGGRFKYWDMKWRKRVEIQGGTYSLGVGGYGLDQDISLDGRGGHWVYWKPELLTEHQIRAIQETRDEFTRRLRVYEGLLSMGLKLLKARKWDVCEQLLDAVFKQQTSHPWAFKFMEFAGGGKYKP